MQYVHILALIDADLERLKKVRLLLTTLDTPPKGTQKRARNPPVRSKTLGTAEGQKPASPALQIDEHEVSQRKNARPALAPKRFSRILSGGWFEWPQVFVEVDGEFRIDVSLDLLVNKQNTAEPADWHLPTDQQRDEYSSAIAHSITAALTSVCIQPEWQGSQVLRCSKLRTSDGAVVRRPDHTDGPPTDPRVKDADRKIFDPK